MNVEKLRLRLATQANKNHEYSRQRLRSSLEYAIAAGDCLLKIEKTFPNRNNRIGGPSEFRSWVQEHVSISLQMVRMYMHLARYKHLISKQTTGIRAAREEIQKLRRISGDLVGRLLPKTSLREVSRLFIKALKMWNEQQRRILLEEPVLVENFMEHFKKVVSVPTRKVA